MSVARSDSGRRQRLKEKYLDFGLDSLTDAEVVELLLTLSTPRKDCKPLARAALKRFGSLRGVLEAGPQKWTDLSGLGPKNVVGLKLVHETARRFLRARLVGRSFFHSAREVFDYLYHALRDKRAEAVHVLYLNAQNEVLAVEESFQGGVTLSRLEPQVVLRRALELGAYGLIVAHNHPSGKPEPSPGDKRTTRELTFAARALNLRLVDHLIIGENRYFSFSEAGLLSRFAEEWERLQTAAG